MKNIYFLSIAAFILSSFTFAQTKALVFTRATVIDMTGVKPRQNMTIVIEGNRIAAIGKTGKARVPKNAQVIDAGGKFLIPGLWDMHHHHDVNRVTREIIFPLEIVNGVTGVRDMYADRFPAVSSASGEPMEVVNRWRREIAAGTLVGPRIIAGNARWLMNRNLSLPLTDVICRKKRAKKC